MVNKSIWSSAAYAGVGDAKAQVSAVSDMRRNATTHRANRPRTCQGRPAAATCNCTIASLSSVASSHHPLGLAPRLPGRNGLALVILTLATSQRDLNFGVPV